MATTLVLRFGWGRYHATPGGWHVNEGVMELPPSPWRLLRALHAVWRTRLPELEEATVAQLLGQLAQPPVFHVPRDDLEPGGHYHFRHDRQKAASADRTRDAFAGFGRGAELAVEWPFDLAPTHHAALERLAGSIPYLGRAESLCEAYLANGWEPGPHDSWVPLDTADTLSSDAVVTSVLAAELPLRPEALLARPLDVRRGKLLFPAGTRLVGYQRCRHAAPPRPRPHPRVTHPTAVRFSVLQATRPPQTDALIYTDLLRQAALSKLNRPTEARQRTQLGGRGEDGTALCGHGHAHYLPLITDRRLSGLVVWVPSGLPDAELVALTRVDRLYTPVNPDWRLAIQVVGIGEPAQVAPELTAVTATRTWRSLTPFTPPRYAKASADWVRFLHAEVGRELLSRALPAPRAVRMMDQPWQPWLRYRLSARIRRDPHQGRACRPSAFLRIELAEPVSGPLALGHLSHFGLGLFGPEAAE